MFQGNPNIYIYRIKVQGGQTDIITSISACSIGWAVVLIYVDTLTTDVIVFISIVHNAYDITLTNNFQYQTGFIATDNITR